jgi:hypothetical protein
MNMLISASAVALTTAAKAAPDQSTLNLNPDYKPTKASILQRAEHAIETLRAARVCEGWSIDEAAAQRALGYLRHIARDDRAQNDDEEAAVIDFFGEHGVSLDWIICGDTRGFICHGASHSRAALRTSSAN